MALLRANQLKKAYGDRLLFEGLSFEVEKKSRIGLVGVNGSGKTTLLSILSGKLNPDEGTVYRQKFLRIGALEQIPKVGEGQTLYEAVLNVFAPLIELERGLGETNSALLNKFADYDVLIKRQHLFQERFEREGGLTYKSRVRSALLGLGFSEEALNLPAAALSGGQLNKAMLARVLLSEPELLLLDEPTNHLDLTASEWLEAFLKTYSGAYIIISHDRYFLDKSTEITLELDRGRHFITAGNYSRHLELRSGKDELELRHFRNTQKEIRRLYGIVEQQRRWGRERNIRMAESKLKQIERLKATLVEPVAAAGAISFAFKSTVPGGNDVLQVSGLQKRFGETVLFDDISFTIRRGERVFLLGPNGSGKTTLLKMLLGQEASNGGSFAFGAGVQAAYYEQNMRALNFESTILEEVSAAYPRMNITALRSALAAFFFRGEDVNKNISSLSGGELGRVQLLKLMLSGSNLLLLDEPTNHLDIASAEALETALEEYDGALLVVTHDRYLINRLADRVLYMTKTGLKEVYGGYDSFIASLEAEPVNAAPKEEKPVNSYKAKKQKQSAFIRARTLVERAEREIMRLEETISKAELKLASPETAVDYVLASRLGKELESFKSKLEESYIAWEIAANELESYSEHITKEG